MAGLRRQRRTVNGTRVRSMARISAKTREDLWRSPRCSVSWVAQVDRPRDVVDAILLIGSRTEPFRSLVEEISAHGPEPPPPGRTSFGVGGQSFGSQTSRRGGKGPGTGGVDGALRGSGEPTRSRRLPVAGTTRGKSPRGDSAMRDTFRGSREILLCGARFCARSVVRALAHADAVAVRELTARAGVAAHLVTRPRGRLLYAVRRRAPGTVGAHRPAGEATAHPRRALRVSRTEVRGAALRPGARCGVEVLL